MGRYIGGSIAKRATTIAARQRCSRKSGLQTVDGRMPQTSTEWRSTIESIYPQLRARPDIDAAMFDELLGVARRVSAPHPAAR